MSLKRYLKHPLIAGIIVAAIASIFFKQHIFIHLSTTSINADSLKINTKDSVANLDSIYEEPKEISTPTQNEPDQENNDKNVPRENLLSYINSSIRNSSDNIDVSVTIVDDDGNISFPISSDLAAIYIQKGEKSNFGLLKNSFVHKKEFQELIDANSDLITKLKLSNYTDYLAIGKISYSMRHGTLVNGTLICTASISMNIISANAKTLANSFSFSVNGNGVSESQAKNNALQKLVELYRSDYSSTEGWQ